MNNKHGFIIMENIDDYISGFSCKYCKRVIYEDEKEYEIIEEKYKFNPEEEKCIKCLYNFHYYLFPKTNNITFEDFFNNKYYRSIFI